VHITSIYRGDYLGSKVEEDAASKQLTKERRTLAPGASDAFIARLSVFNARWTLCQTLTSASNTVFALVALSSPSPDVSDASGGPASDAWIYCSLPDAVIRSQATV
jgi:hypothetical protein